MHHFIALVWNSADPERTARALDIARRLRTSAPEWVCAFDADGLMVFHRGARERASQVYPLHGHAGVILGKLFHQGSRERKAPAGVEFDRRESEIVTSTQGRHLMDRYWGRYVAFLKDEARRTNFILRDPASAAPCFTVRYRNIDLFFSHVEDICRLDQLRYSVNWRYIAAFLLYDRPGIRKTGLRDVLEVLPGECIETEGDRVTRTFLWHPADFCDRGGFEVGAEAARALAETVRLCVGAWASAYDRIVHELSGGLDSAIVLGCLAREAACPEVTCLNIFTEQAEGDERAFARAGASAAGVPLVEREIRPWETSLERMLEIPGLANPHIATIGLTFENLYRDLAQERNAGAFFSGQGGDHLFLQRKSALVAADHVRRHGLGHRLFRVIGDTARYTGQSLWEVSAAALRHGVLRRAIHVYADPDREHSFLDPDILDAAQEADFVHPWLTSCRGMPPAKLLHIADVINLQGYYFPFGRATCADLVYPLYSQPIVELCLRIPTYVLTEGGRDRSLARRAFADIVPRAVLDRESKGDITGFYNTLLSHDLDFARALLLDGVLVEQRILDPDKLERQLTEEHMVRGGQIVEIMNCLVVEAWARSWASAGPEVAR